MRGLGFQSMAPFGLRRVRQRVERSSSENLSTAERRAAGAEASGESFFLGGGEGKGHWVSGWRSLLHSQIKLAAGAELPQPSSPDSQRPSQLFLLISKKKKQPASQPALLAN